jgi:hypothetical protein
MPGWIPYLNIWKILSIFAYTQAFALLESAFILLLLTILAVILPARLFRDKFAVQGTTIVFMTTFWTILFQSIFFNVRQWALAQFFVWFGLSLVSIVIACVLVHRSRRIEKAVSALAERLTVFLYIYIPLGLLGLIVVIIRNIV